MNKILNLKDEIINNRYGLKYINIKDKEKLEEQLKELKVNGMLDKYNITYAYTEHDEYLALVLYKPMDIF